MFESSRSSGISRGCARCGYKPARSKYVVRTAAIVLRPARSVPLNLGLFWPVVRIYREALSRESKNAAHDRPCASRADPVIDLAPRAKGPWKHGIRPKPPITCTEAPAIVCRTGPQSAQEGPPGRTGAAARVRKTGFSKRRSGQQRSRTVWSTLDPSPHGSMRLSFGRYLADFGAPAEGETRLTEDDIPTSRCRAIVDLSAVLSEALALALPYHPRAEGAELAPRASPSPGRTPMTDEDVRTLRALEGASGQGTGQERKLRLAFRENPCALEKGISSRPRPTERGSPRDGRPAEGPPEPAPGARPRIRGIRHGCSLRKKSHTLGAAGTWTAGPMTGLPEGGEPGGMPETAERLKRPQFTFVPPAGN